MAITITMLGHLRLSPSLHSGLEGSRNWKLESGFELVIRGNRNEYSTKRVQLDYVSAKNNTKTADRICSAFC